MAARGPYGQPAPAKLEAEAPRRQGASRLPSEEEAARERSRPPRVARGVSAVLLVICLVGAMQAVFMIVVEARRLWTAEREIVRLEGEVADLRREAADLMEVAMRGDDMRFREQLARRQGYVYPHETRYLPLSPGGP